MLERWCAAMEKPSRRMMMLSNILFDAISGRTPKPVFQTVMTAVADEWKKLCDDGSDNSSRPEDILIEAIKKSGPAVLCGGPEIDPGGVRVARVTEAFGWYAHTMEKAKGVVLRNEVPEEILHDIEANGVDAKMIQPGAQIRGEWEQAWVTKADDLNDFENEQSDPYTLPANVRDFLGLIHIDDGAQVIRIDYPDDALSTKKLNTPTFIDGCGTRVYRSSDQRRPWGTTVNLASVKQQGAAEAVHRPIPFTAEFRIRYLGRIDGRTHSFNYRQLVAACPRPWQNGDETHLENLL